MVEVSGRIGVIYPSDGTLDDEFWRCAPPRVSVHLTRSLASADLSAGLSPSQQHTLLAESPDIDEAAGRFSLIGAGCVAYACTVASFTRGVGYDTEIIERIEAASGSPATTTSTAAVLALRSLGVRRLSVAAPYEDEACEKLCAFLQGSGFEVVSLKNLGLCGTDIGAVPSERVYALGKQAMESEAEGLFISCTAFRTIEILDSLEQDIGKPVVSANQATMWHALQTAKLYSRMEGLGRLYRL